MRAWCISFFALITAFAAFGDVPARRNVPPDGSSNPVYVIVLSDAKPPIPDLAERFHATVLSRWSTRMVIQLPESEANLLEREPAVTLMQRLYGTNEERPKPALKPTSMANPAVTPNAGSGGWSSGTYQYDGSGNIKAIGPDSDGVTRRYLYDELSRLTSAGYEGPNATPGTYQSVHTYEYDSFGNRTKETTPTTTQSLTVDTPTNHANSSTATANTSLSTAVRSRRVKRST